MPIKEIESRQDAATRYRAFFPRSIHDEDYIDLVSFLSRPEWFTTALEEVSKDIWVEYNTPELAKAQNRYTRAILNLARKRGLQNQMNVVLTDAANPADFGNLIRNGFLWKDSFAPGHGEFAHSYQWLSASTEFIWAGRTGAVYRAVAGVKSTVPFFVKDEGPITLRPAFLWEWLVDCTEYQDKFDNQAQQAIPVWCEKQLNAWCANALTNSWFVSGGPCCSSVGWGNGELPVWAITEEPNVLTPNASRKTRNARSNKELEYFKITSGMNPDSK